jgi:uncharacterized protein involved in type VI secretion and phage assembly
VLTEISGQAALSEPFRYYLKITANKALPLEDCLGSTTTATIARDNVQRFINGRMLEFKKLK